ncbi:MAG: M23 family metallopeptidase [Bacteroidales bacterium]|nr:M23 family metallopeptidase [Bacteroidales bacterium]
MARQKYVFNHKTLNYEKFEESKRKRVGKAVLYVLSTFVLALLFFFLFYSVFESPKEKMQARELEYMKLQYEILDDRLNDMNVLLEDMEQRDDNIYRMIFEADPIPASVRKAGFGGVDRYENLYGYKNSDLVVRAAKKLDIVASQLYVQSKSYDEVFAMAKNKLQMLACTPAIIPIKESEIRQISSYFGYRTDPIYKISKFHSGIDFAAAVGTEVFVTADGVVEKLEQNFWGYGNMITVDHGYGYKTRYAHLSRFGSHEGQKVKRGQVIGYVGSTGKSTGSHLHYEVIKNGELTDPMHFFFNDLTPEEYENILKQAESPSITMD